MKNRRLFFPAGEAGEGGGGKGKKAAAAELPVIGAPVSGKPGWFHPGKGDDGMADRATHTPTGDKTPYLKVGGLWVKASVEEIDAKGLAGIADS